MPRIFIDGDSGTTGLENRERLADRRDLEIVSIARELRKDVEAKRDLLAAWRSRSCACPTTPRARPSGSATGLARARRACSRLDRASYRSGWVYGFAELGEGQAERIADAARVANPGCYATGAIALLRPLVDAGLVVAGMAVTINAVSGYSGGGRQMIEAYEARRAPPFELYALGFEH